jgi:predicted dehydrogenase
MQISKLQVGVVGVGPGGIGFDQHLPGWAKVPFASVVAVADLSDEALDRACEEFAIPRRFQDWHELVAMKDVDIVDICTPNRTHAAIALAALKNGKHVLCEKPLATTAADVRSLREAAVRAERLIMTAQHLRFQPRSRQLKALLDAGLFGDIYYTRAQWLRRRLLPPRTTFIEQRLSGGGAAFDIGVHVLDLAYWLQGCPEPVSVSAATADRLARRPDISGDWGDWDHERINVEDFAAAFVRFANGAVLTLETSWLGFQPEGELQRLQSFGTQGGFVWPDGIVTGETNKVPWELRVARPAENLPHHEEILEFAGAVRDRLSSPLPIEQTLQVTRIIEALYRSSQLRREVTVE